MKGELLGLVEKRERRAGRKRRENRKRGSARRWGCGKRQRDIFPWEPINKKVGQIRALYSRKTRKKKGKGEDNRR